MCVDDLKKFDAQKRQELAEKEQAVRWTGLSESGRAGYQTEIDLLRGSILPVLAEELARLADFQWIYERRGIPDGGLSTVIAKKERERVDIEAMLKKARDEIQTHEAVLAGLANVSPVEQVQLLALIDPRQVTVKDVVRDHVANFRALLDEKDHMALLEMIVKLFIDQPRRYPLWLQYMVVHFSGMRYQSAHGSWADPKWLLVSLRSRAVAQQQRAVKPRAGGRR